MILGWADHSFHLVEKGYQQKLDPELADPTSLFPFKFISL